MANYNVGNIEIGAVAKTNDTIAKLDKIIAKLQQVKDIQSKSKSSQSGVNKELAKTKSQTDKNTNAQKKYKQEIDKTKTSVDTLSRNLKGIINFGKLYAFINYTKRFFIFTSRMVIYASDYVEILNKFQVSFGKLTNENIEFVEKLSKAYGFSRATLMDYQATFNNMLKSLEGLTDEMSARISRTLTQMAIDYSSLFNQSIESTMLAFQSMLSGSIRPIRSVSGFDVSETSIFAIYQELGGTKTMRQLTQLEKRLLRIIAVQQQMQEVGATGDFYRTIETFSNQVKILQEQLKEFGVIWGRLFLVKLKPAIQYLNGFLIALNEIGKVVTKNIELTDDFNIDEEFAGFEKIESDINDTAESIDNLNNSITQLGLDQLNVLGGSKGVSSLLEIDPVIEQGLQEYVANLDKVNMKAKEIAKSILEWAGYTYNASGELEKTGNRLTSIIASIVTISGIIVGAKIYTQVSAIAKSISSISAGLSANTVALGFVNAKIVIIAGAIATIVTLFTLLYTTNENFRDSFNNLLGSFKNVLTPIINAISIVLQETTPLINTIIDNLANLLVPILDSITPIIETIGLLLESILPILSSIVGSVSDDLKPVLDNILIPINAIGNVIEFIVGLISSIIQFATATASSGFYGLNGILETLKLSFEAVGEALKSLLTGDVNGALEIFKNLGENLKKVWVDVGTSIKNVFIGVINNVITMFETFINNVVRTINNITSKLSGLWTWMGIPAIPQINEVSFNRLSQSTPNVSMSGDYSNITSSSSSGNGALSETVMEATVPVANAILQGNNEIVRTLKQQRTTLNVNGRELAEATYDDYQNVGLRKGKIVFNN